MKIDVSRITDRQKLIIEKGLLDYKYIMDNRDSDDEDFRIVYYEFYLKARWAVMGDPDARNIYFSLMKNVSPDADLIEILKKLKTGLRAKTSWAGYEFSIGSKLLHTRNASVPIYDSKVRDYLSKEEGIQFQWQIPNKISGATRGTTEEEKIENDWKKLQNWYSELFAKPRGKEWVDWFDGTFPSYKGISNVKKVDFIIFATN